MIYCLPLSNQSCKSFILGCILPQLLNICTISLFIEPSKQASKLLCKSHNHGVEELIGLWYILPWILIVKACP